MQDRTLEQLKLLAELEIRNSKTIDFLAELLFTLIEADLREGRFAAGASVIASEIEQEEARARDAGALREKLRKAFALPDPAACGPTSESRV